MKKFLILFVFPILLLSVACNGNKTMLSQEDLKAQAQKKVDEMQDLIHFDDAQAAQLIELEYRYVRKVQKAQHCFFCNSEKRIEKLKGKKSLQLQRILTREQYIKYDAVENGRIKKGHLIVE